MVVGSGTGKKVNKLLAYDVASARVHYALGGQMGCRWYDQGICVVHPYMTDKFFGNLLKFTMGIQVGGYFPRYSLIVRFSCTP